MNYVLPSTAVVSYLLYEILPILQMLEGVQGIGVNIRTLRVVCLRNSPVQGHSQMQLNTQTIISKLNVSLSYGPSEMQLLF